MSTATESLTGIEGLEDWEPEFACEHPHHGDGPAEGHDHGPATHWAETDHECFGPVGTPYPVCAGYVASPLRGGLMCSWCGAPINFNTVRVLGPINPAA